MEEHVLYSDSSDKIKRFLRKAVASQAYGDMFANGQYFKDLGLSIPRADVYSFGAYEHLKKLSHSNFRHAVEEVGPLDANQKRLLRKVCTTELWFQHRTNAELVPFFDGEEYYDYGSYEEHEHTLSILSYKQLMRKNIAVKAHTDEDDIHGVRNCDFVFFNCEFGNNSTPLNRFHNGRFYGTNSYVIGIDHPMVKYGYMTLTDHTNYKIFPSKERAAKDLFYKFPELRGEVVERVIYQKGNIEDTPIFDYTLMRPALALYLIGFSQRSKSQAFRDYLYNPKLTYEQLHVVLTTVYAPEFHIPRAVFTKTFEHNEGL